MRYTTPEQLVGMAGRPELNEEGGETDAYKGAGA